MTDPLIDTPFTMAPDEQVLMQQQQQQRPERRFKPYSLQHGLCRQDLAGVSLWAAFPCAHGGGAHREAAARGGGRGQRGGGGHRWR